MEPAFLKASHRNSQYLNTSIHCLLTHRYRPESPNDARQPPSKADGRDKVEAAAMARHVLPPPSVRPERHGKSLNYASEFGYLYNASRTNREQRQVPTKPSPSKAEQSTKGTWIEELQRRHQAALMEEIKEQILFKPTDHFSISSVFDENGGEPFPPRRKSLAAKRRMLDDELEDIREPSTSSSSSSDSQVQQTEPLPSSRADGWSSTMTNDGRPASSTPQITPSKSKFFEDATSVEPLEKKDTTSSTVSTPRRTTSQTPTQRAADPSAMFTPRRRSDWVPASTTLTPQIRLGATQTPKKRESHGAEAARRKEATRTFDPIPVSPGVAATPRRETAIPTTPALQMPNTRPESASTLWESREFRWRQKRKNF
ncbi:endochitinase A-like [Ixodes scapularis]